MLAGRLRWRDLLLALPPISETSHGVLLPVGRQGPVGMEAMSCVLRTSNMHAACDATLTIYYLSALFLCFISLSDAK